MEKGMEIHAWKHNLVGHDTFHFAWYTFYLETHLAGRQQNLYTVLESFPFEY